jgi:hypothetical protein
MYFLFEGGKYAFFVRRQQEDDKNKKVTDGAKQLASSWSVENLLFLSCVCRLVPVS